MKRLFYFLMAAAACFLVSCEKGINSDVPNTPSTPSFTGKTLTFSVEMDLPATTKAALEGLNIRWQSTDSIGIATDNSATIVAYPVTDRNGTNGVITVNEVTDAKEYYAIFRGSNATYSSGNFTGVTFNTETKTFSGLTVGQQQVSAGEFNSHLYITNGYPLTMAGKTSGLPQSGHLVMKPCLALFQVQLASTDLPGSPNRYFYKNVPFESSYSVNHDHYYSAIRGFNFYQKGASTIYSSGDFAVQIASDGTLTTTPGTTKYEDREISKEDTLRSNTKYLMCLIPGGSVTSFRINFLGYNGNSKSNLTWSSVYSMTKTGSYTVAPGDFYDLGTLNPIGRKMAQNEAADEAADAAAAYTPEIDIDGEFDDWDGIAELSGNRPGGAANSVVPAWRLYADDYNIFVYLKIATDNIKDTRYIYVCFDTDNNEKTGDSQGGVPGTEQFVVVFPTVNASSPYSFVEGADGRSQVNGSTDGTIQTWGIYDTGVYSTSTYSYVELCIPRSKVSLTSAKTVSVAVSYNWYNTAKQSLVLE